MFSTIQGAYIIDMEILITSDRGVLKFFSELLQRVHSLK